MKNLLSLSNTKCAAVAIVAVLTGPAAAIAEVVHLNAYDGSTRLVGDLIAAHNGSYELQTELGVLRIPASFVRCEGAACPSMAQVMADLEPVDGEMIYHDASFMSSALSLSE